MGFIGQLFLTDKARFRADNGFSGRPWGELIEQISGLTLEEICLIAIHRVLAARMHAGKKNCTSEPVTHRAAQNQLERRSDSRVAVEFRVYHECSGWSRKSVSLVTRHMLVSRMSWQPAFTGPTR